MSKSNKCTKCKEIVDYNEVLDYSYTISFYSTPAVIRQGTCSMCKGIDQVIAPYYHLIYSLSYYIHTL
jgi:hypothetical protein